MAENHMDDAAEYMEHLKKEWNEISPAVSYTHLDVYKRQVDALRKIEAGVNGAKIDTLISIAELFHITLDYLVCGCERKAEVDYLLVGLKEKEVPVSYTHLVADMAHFLHH